MSLFPNLSTAKANHPPTSSVLETMSLDQKVGQLFMVGFPQTELTPDLAKFLRKNKPGAFVIFKRNMHSLETTQVLNLGLYDLAMTYSSVPPLIAVDQEGGQVARITTTPPMLNALSVGQANSTELAERLGKESALVMKELGFNMNLAPVLDVSDPFQFSFIGVRSFGSDPNAVAKMGYAFSKGLILGGIVPTGKHFPGTGSSSLDPHLRKSENPLSRKELFEKHLPPFQQFSRLGIFSSLMVSHSSYPQLDSDNKPAVFSKKIIQGLLRDTLKFRGLVITDDLQMSASRTLLRPEEAALTALKAGNDIVMLTWSFAEQSRAISRVRQAVISGELPMKELNQKVARILKLKHYLSPKMSTLLALKPSPQLLEIDDAVLDRNLLALESKSLPPTRGPICVLSSSAEFLRSFRSGYGSQVYLQLMVMSTTPAKITAFVNSNACDKIVYTVLGQKTAAILGKLSKLIKRKTIVTNLSLPGLVLNSETYEKVLNLYFPHQNAGKKIAQLLNKDYALND